MALVTNASYLPFGPLSSISFGNGQVLTRSYDQNYDIDRIQSPAIDYDYSVDAVGNITTPASLARTAALPPRQIQFGFRVRY